MSDTLQNESPPSERPGSRSQDGGLLAFGRFELDRESGELLRGGERVKLQPQPFRVLQMLAEKAGRVVTREELREEIWGDAYVDWEAGLNLCILQIRRALGDKARDPDFVETLPRRGYRFLPRVEEHRRGEDQPFSPPAPSDSLARAAASIPDSSSPLEEDVIALSEDELDTAAAAAGAWADVLRRSRGDGTGTLPPPAQRGQTSRSAWWPTALLIIAFALVAGRVNLANEEAALPAAAPENPRLAAVPALFPELSGAESSGAKTAAVPVARRSGRLPMSTPAGKALPLTSSEKLSMEEGVCALLQASLAEEADCEVRLAASGTAEQDTQDSNKYTLIGTVEREGETLSITAQLTPVEDSASEAERVVPRAQPSLEPVQKTRVASTGDGGAEECKALGQCLDSLPEIPTRTAVPGAKYAQPTSATSEALPGLNMPSP